MPCLDVSVYWVLMDLVRLQWSWIPDYISSPSTVSPSREAEWQLWELPYIGINCSRWATSLKKNQSSTIFCLTGIMWQKSAQGEVEQNTWLLINWLSGSLDSPKPQRFPELLVPKQLTCKITLRLHETSDRLGPGFDFESSMVLLQKHGRCILLLF